MSRGFGVTQSKRRNFKKSSEQKVQTPDMRQCDVQPEIQTSLEEDWRVNAEKQALAWRAGVYNPLGSLQLNQARSLNADEEEWLFLARTIGWLQVENELDAIYFTAPPPAFDKTQADWYLRPDLTNFIEEPVLLREAMVSYSIPHNLAIEAIARHAKRLKWKSGKTKVFIQEVTAKPNSKLTNEDYTAVLLELQHL